MNCYTFVCLVSCTVLPSVSSSQENWESPADSQFHIQTDEGPERYFKYQTASGQYRKEKRLEDGTVIGSYGWIDANGYFRLRDYIADDQGYRILKTKNIFVGKERGISQAVNSARRITPSAGVAVAPAKHKPKYLEKQAPTPQHSTKPYVQIPRPSSSFVLPYRPPFTKISTNDIDDSPETPGYYSNGPSYPVDRTGNGYDPQYPYYDGVSVTKDGFRYYLPRQYHEEQTLRDDVRSGSFGYIDPFGIRRVIYYNSSPSSGFQHKKNNRYVGFHATPYDPRPYR